MELEKVFKNIILLFVLLTVLSFVQLYFSEPNPDYVMIDEDMPLFIDIISSPLNYILGTIMFVAYFTYLFSLFLLYKFKKSGKNIFIYSVVTIIVISSFTTGSFFTGLNESFNWIEYAFDGAIIVFLYFTPIKDKFN